MARSARNRTRARAPGARRSVTRRPIRSRADAERLSPRSRLSWRNSLEALALMRREGLSLTAAAKAVGSDPSTVRRYVGATLKKEDRRWQPTPSDQLYRPMQFVTPRGLVTLDVTASRTATRIAEYWAAVDWYLRTGRTERLRPFRGKAVRVGKVGHPFITDPRTLDRLADAGTARFEDLYEG